MKISPKQQTAFLDLDGNPSIFRKKLEKHLDDVRKGRPQASKEVNSNLGDLNIAADNYLANNHPATLANYSAYLGALDYARRARYITGVYEASRALSKIQIPGKPV